MKQPEANSSESKAVPDKDLKKKAVSGPVIDSRPVSAGEAAAAAVSEPKPLVESKLVGSGEGPAAAAPKPQPAGKPLSESQPAAAPPPVPPKPAEKSSVPPSAPTQPAPTRVETKVVEVRKAGFVPTLLGGVIAAGLGAAVTWWALPHLPAAWQPGASEEAPNEAQIAAARDAGSEAARAEIQTRADAFAKRAAEAGADAARQALADAGDAEALKAQAEKLAALEKTVSDLAARPAVSPVVSGEDGAGLRQFLDDVNGRLSAQQLRIDELAARSVVDPAVAERLQGFAAQAEALQTQIASAAAEAEKRIAAAESQAGALQESADAANRRALGATAAAALQAAIETGGAREQALSDLRAAGIEPPPVLAGDVPTLEQLRAEFPAAAREGLAASIKQAPQSDGALGAIGDFLRVQTGARSVEPREGSDPDAVLSRADAAVKAGDLKGALAEIATLPQPGQDAMSGWTGRAKVWVEANAALAALAAGSL
ncbi:Uncharacterized conserved protein [Paracoccus aminovorans]|uniref:Uncharacterized conserved protein n=1 Tax=Paracoccus aminovorans TaxID=34004 RepID=A0A1I3B9G2_9RHOB|nr:hypothetical protein [Paracoccus aminovorans]CQR85397.1 hypothetical protein JCM7685_0817 [Paracoccus aminovorans]SFH58726.1 Uncharacterized conserved protein [Paracoccus aminovorans]